MTRRPTPHVRYIYVIGPEVGLQKIGLANDPRARLAALQTACAHDLFLHALVGVPFGDAHDIERRAHQLLAKACVRNEWFDVTPDEAIAAVRKAAAGRTVRLQHTLAREAPSAIEAYPNPPLVSLPLPLPLPLPPTSPGDLPLFGFQR